MSARRIVYLAHSLRSDWNNGNAHFLRGLLRGLQACGQTVSALEPAAGWSYTHLLGEGERGLASLKQFGAEYSDLRLTTYSSCDDQTLETELREADIAIVHEWNEPELVERVLALRARYGFRTLFHDTHHRASSSPEALRRLRVAEFDGVLAFGEVLRRLYRERWGAPHVWTLHEAADVQVFYPRQRQSTRDLVWIGNWGDDERTAELHEFLLEPAHALPVRDALVYGVRYPQAALDALSHANSTYGGYLANLDAPAAFAEARCTVHVPRRQYAEQLPGIPTIRVFEALACGIPLISAPWRDVECLFGIDDFVRVSSGAQMVQALGELLRDEPARQQRAAAGLATVRARHTTLHRAQQLSAILDEVFA